MKDEPTDLEVRASRFVGRTASLLAIVKRQGSLVGNQQVCDELLREAKAWPDPVDWDAEVEDVEVLEAPERVLDRVTDEHEACD